jgi:spermidine synthase
VMDGRTYLRRIDKIYDVITLEPMPPSFAGTNALYSQEFYKLARSRLSSEGMIAQWLPFHLISAHDSASITKTFQSVFPNAVLWLDPPSKTGILLGSVSDSHKLAQDLPGFDRSGGHRDLSREETEDALLLDRSALESYAREGEIITDDNQFLSYGPSARQTRNSGIRGEKHDILNLAKPPRKN